MNSGNATTPVGSYQNPFMGFFFSKKNHKMNREVKTDLFNIIDLVLCAEDYGYGDEIFYGGMFDITGPVTDEELRAFLDTYPKGHFGEEEKDDDWRNPREMAFGNLQELRNKYGK